MALGNRRMRVGSFNLIFMPAFTSRYHLVFLVIRLTRAIGSVTYCLIGFKSNGFNPMRFNPMRYFIQMMLTLPHAENCKKLPEPG